MNEVIANERDPWTCPICGCSCENSLGCEHLALVRYDDGDSDPCDARGVLCSSSEEVTYAFDDLYEAVLHFSMIWLAGTDDVRKILDKQLKRLPGEMARLSSVIRALRDESIEDIENEDFEAIVPWLYYVELTVWFEELFTCEWNRQPTSIATDDYVISHSPGLSWSGTHYWATNGERCLPSICKVILAVAADFRKATQGLLKQLASLAGARCSIDKAEAWIRFYRKLRHD